MLRFHVCNPDHDCELNQIKHTSYEVGTKIVFAANQFKQSVAETLTVRIVPTAV